MIEPDINERMMRFAPSQQQPDVDPIAAEIASQSMMPSAQPTMQPLPDVDPVARDIAERSRENLNSAVLGARAVNPDEAAKAIGLGRKIGIPPEVARADIGRAEQQAYLMDLRSKDFERTDPIMANFLANKEFAEVAHDDVGVLDAIRPIMQDWAMVYWTGATPGMRRGFERGQLVAERGDIGAKAMTGFAGPEDFDRAKQVELRMRELTDIGFLGATTEVIAQNLAQLKGIGTGAVAGAAVGSVVPVIGTIGGGALGATAGVMATTAQMEAGNLYLDLRQQGVSDDTAIPTAIAGGYLNGIIEVVGMKIAAKPFQALAKRMLAESVAKAVAQPTVRAALATAGKGYLMQVGSEATEEALQEVVIIAGEEIAKAIDNVDTETSMAQAMDRVVDAFTQGAMGAAILGGIGPGANLYVDMRRAATTQRQQDFFQRLSETSKESRLAQRSPDAYERFLEAQAKGGPAETIYVDARVAQQVFAQSGLTPQQLEEVLPGIRAQVETEVATGGDVTIQTARFGARLANTDLGNSLLPHMRLDPDAMSVTEAQEFNARRQETVREAEQILAQKQEADGAFVAEARDIEDTLAAQIVATGQMDEKAARTSAQFMRDFYVTQAAALGITPRQVYERFPVRVEGAMAPAAMEQAAAPTGVFNANNPPRPAMAGERILAVMTDDGTIYYDRAAKMHGDLTETFPDIADRIIDGGFIVDGQYQMGLSDGGYSAFEGDAEQVARVRQFAEQANARIAPGVMEQAAVPASLDAVANVESAFEFAGKKAFKTNRAFKQELQDRVLAAAKDAGIDLSQFTPEVEQYLVRVAVADAITALRTNPNAVGWYNEKVTKALRLVSLVHPEIATDPRAKFAFTWALAVTSNGQEVNKNFQLAERVYREYKQTGQMPTNVPAGQAQIAINASLGLFNELVAKYGIDAVEQFMTTKTTVKEVMAYTNKNVSGENLTTEVYGAAALGPKIGNGFFANLYGYFEQLTMDRWLMRTWGRWTGTLLDDNRANIATKRKQLAAMIKSMSANDKKAFEKIIGSKLSVSKPDDVAVAIQKASVKPANRIEMARIGIADAAAQETFATILGEPARGIQRMSFGDELRKVGNALAKYLDGQKEAPSGPPERARIRRVMSQVLAELQTQFPSLTMSDLQALLWYPEKRLYDAAKTADEGKTGYDDNEAPDYANAAANLARTQGISDDVISATIAQVDDELSAISVERAAGAERGIGNLVLRQDARFGGIGFEQTARGSARGGFDPKRLTTILTKTADLSTFLHESAHAFLTFYEQVAATPDAPARIVSDMDELLRWFKIDGATPAERLAKWNGLTLDQKRQYHETFAYNFEVYLFDGKAPSVEMQGLFERFSVWLKRVYRSIRDDLNAIYRREFGEDLPILTGEVRQVMDRMLATDEQIRRQAAINEMKPMFQSQEQSGMDDAEWAAYQAMQQEAIEAAVTDMNKASLRQMQWLGNARSRILKDIQRKHDRQRKEVSAEVAAAVRVEPVYRAMTYLRTGRFIDADGTEVEVEGPHRLDTKRVKAIYETVPTAESLEPLRATGMPLPTVVQPNLAKLGTGAGGMMGLDGLDPDLVAETFGYSSGDQLMRALVAARPIKEEVAARTDAEMLRRFGDMNTPKAVEAEVQAALHNEARARFVAVELRYVARATEPVRVMLDAAKQVARELIAGRRVRDVRPSDFVAAEARAARDASRIGSPTNPVAIGQAAQTRAYNEAIAAGTDPAEAMVAAIEAGAEAARMAQERSDALKAQYGAEPQQALIRAKRAQLYQNQLAAEALRVQEEVAKAVKYLRRVLRDENVKRMGAPAADQIAGLLERHEVAPVSLKRLDERRALAEWLAAQEAAGLVPDIAPEIANEARRINYREVKVSEFRDLVDAVKQIEFVGKNERKLQLAEERAAFEETRDEIVTRIRAVAKVRGLDVDPRSPLTNIGRTAAALRGFAAQHLKAASVARILDGGKDDGPLWNAIIRTANAAADMETTMRAEASAKLAEILGPVFKLGNMGGKGIYFPSIDRALNREARIAIALNVGNDGNRQRLLDGEGWTMEQIQPVLESLTEAEWQAVQRVWDYIDTYRPLIAEKERRLYGKTPEWVEAVPMTVRTADGKVVNLTGGYYPIKYDPVASDRVATIDEVAEAKRAMDGAYTAATTRRSFVKARAKEVVDRPLLYTLDAAFSGVNDVIHDLAWHEWLIGTNRLLRDTEFANAVRETRGPEFLKQLRDWAKDNAAGERKQQVAGEGALSWLRQGISASGLGFNIVSAIMQVTGFNQSIVRVGAKYVGRGIAQFAGAPIATARMVADKSQFMAERGRTQFRELNEIRNRVRGQTEVARRVTAGTYFLMMNMQRTVDVPTWLGAYQKALDAGKTDAKAVALADQAVRETQGSGLISDLAAIERGGPMMKLFTVFYSYMNTVYNMTAVQTYTARGRGKLAADYVMLLVVPVVLGQAIKNLVQPDADDDELDPEELARKLAAEELSFIMGTMVIAREFGGAAQLLTGAEGVRMGYGGPAGLRAVGEVYGLATQAGQLEFDRAFRRSAINTLGAFTGLPSAQINRTIDGIEAVVEGEVTGVGAVAAPFTGVQR